MNKRKILPLLGSFFLFPQMVAAHCPLCTIGAAAVTGGAVWLGVQKSVVALFLGAFAISTGLWVARMIKRKLFRGQDILIALASFLLTIVPLYGLIYEMIPLPIFWFGDYGSLLNRTYLFNVSILTSIVGGFLVFVAPYFSKKITEFREGKLIRFQGILLTFALLILSGVVVQVVV